MSTPNPSPIHSANSKQFWKEFWRKPLVFLSVVAAGFALVAFIIAAIQHDSLSITLLSNIITFLASGLVSYLITHSHERQQFAQDRAKLSKLSGRRVNILSAKLVSLTEELACITTLEQTRHLVGYELRNVANDIKLSVLDIKDMGSVEDTYARLIEDRSIEVGQVISEEEASSPASASMRSEETIIYSCPNCGYSNTSTLETTRGTTKQVSCGSCHIRLFLHRIANGAHRVVDPSRGRLSNYTASEGVSQSASSPSLNVAPIQRSFECPRCQNRIAFVASMFSQRIVEKPCFACLAVVSYNRELHSARLVHEKRPVYIDSIDLSSLECLNCHIVFAPRRFSADDGKNFICCFRCNTIYLARSDMKSMVEKPCPSPECGRPVTFKISESATEARQFCLECFSRLLYRRGTDEVSVLETLTIPKVTFAEFNQDGRRCPHCQKPASGGYTINSRGQKLSICWNCKNVFELIESPFAVARSALIDSEIGPRALPG